MIATENQFCKVTLFLIKDWDAFQAIMRSGLRGGK